MKTNNVMIRPMGVFNVTQRTKDGMFNATELLKQWNESTGSNKEIKEFFKNKNTEEFIQALIEEENLHGENSTYVKSKASRGLNAGTWMHPYLFVKFAMWINPTFEVKVIKFVYDKMLEYRNDNCEAYKILASAISKIVPQEFMRNAMQKVGEALNWIVFGCHEKEMRNKQGEEAKQRELFELEKKVAELIDEGFIKDYDHLINYLRQRWRDRNTPKCFRPCN